MENNWWNSKSKREEGVYWIDSRGVCRKHLLYEIEQSITKREVDWDSIVEYVGNKVQIDRARYCNWQTGF